MSLSLVHRWVEHSSQMTHSRPVRPCKYPWTTIALEQSKQFCSTDKCTTCGLQSASQTIPWRILMRSLKHSSLIVTEISTFGSGAAKLVYPRGPHTTLGRISLRNFKNCNKGYKQCDPLQKDSVMAGWTDPPLSRLPSGRSCFGNLWE